MREMLVSYICFDGTGMATFHPWLFSVAGNFDITSALSVSGSARVGNFASVFSELHLGSNVSLRSFARLGSGVSTSKAGFLGGHLSSASRAMIDGSDLSVVCGSTLSATGSGTSDSFLSVRAFLGSSELFYRDSSILIIWFFWRIVLSEFTKAAIVMFGNAVVFPSPSSRLCLLSAMYRTAKRNN